MPFSLIVQTDRTTCGAEQLVQNQNNVFISEKLVVVEGDETKPHPTATYPAIIKNPNNISKVFINNIPIVVEEDGLPEHGSSPHSESDSLYTNNGLNVKAY
jgi:hypothetical protein